MRRNVNSTQGLAWTYDVADLPGHTRKPTPQISTVFSTATPPRSGVSASNAATGRGSFNWKFRFGWKKGVETIPVGVTWTRRIGTKRIFAGIREYVYSLDAKNREGPIPTLAR